MAQLGSILVAMVMLCITHAQKKEPTINVVTTYFGSHSFLCNNSDVNIDAKTPDKLYWMLPTGKLVSEDSELVKDALIITERNGLAFNLTITRITDDEFGYYTCIIRYSNPDDIKVVRWGLNLNGPDFSDLQEQYRLSAITGAIAASVLLGVLGLACIIWHCRFSKRSGREDEGPGSDYAYDNSAAVAMDDLEVKKKPAPSDNDTGDTANGVSSPTSIDVKL